MFDLLESASSKYPGQIKMILKSSQFAKYV